MGRYQARRSSCWQVRCPIVNTCSAARHPASSVARADLSGSQSTGSASSIEGVGLGLPLQALMGSCLRACRSWTLQSWS